MRKTLASILLLLAAVALAAVRWLDPVAPGGGQPGPASVPTVERRPPGLPQAAQEAAPQKGARTVDDLDPRLQGQIRAVMESVERSGRPPEGVAQGGRRGKTRGVFENAEGRLPAQA